MSAPLSGLRIGLVTASASRLGGGVFEAVAVQAALIGALGGEAPVFALADAHSADDAARFATCGVTHCAVSGPAQIGFAPALLPALRDARLDLIHLHGIWMYPSRAATRWARLTGRGYLVSPHGMLDPWITARGRWKKALARAGYERASWAAATRLHALTAREAADIARESGRDDSLIIANAGPVPAPCPAAPRARHAVYIGRIHPKKNLLALIAGWRAAALPAPCRLTIAGWGEAADVAALEAAIAAAGPGASDSVEFIGPVYGEAKQALLRGASFTILPSLSEGLPMAMLEGWAAGTPAIMTDDCNLPEGFARGAALRCGHSPAEIAETLRAAFALSPEAWLTKAAAAHELAATRFAPDAIAAQWADAYRGAIAEAAARKATQ